MLYRKLLLTFQSRCTIWARRQSNPAALQMDGQLSLSIWQWEGDCRHLEMFYFSLSLSPADFYLKLPPSCRGDSRWSFLLFRRHPFSLGLQSSVAKSKAAPLQSVRGYDKKPCDKGLLCNLMGPETERSVHFNELRSSFLITVVEEMTHWIILPGKTHTHTHLECVSWRNTCRLLQGSSSVDKLCCKVGGCILGIQGSRNKVRFIIYIDNIKWVWSISKTWNGKIQLSRFIH